MTSRDTFRRYLRYGQAGLTRHELRMLKVGRQYIWQPGIQPGEPDTIAAMPFPLELVKRILSAFPPSARAAAQNRERRHSEDERRVRDGIKIARKLMGGL